MELTEKQESYKKILFGKLHDELEYCQRKLNSPIVKSLGKEQVYKDTIQAVNELLEKEWTKENFSELVRAFDNDKCDFQKYAK